MQLTGKSVVVTGSTGGIGKETARRLAELGARIMLVGRDAERAEAAAVELRRSSGNEQVEAIAADLSRIGAVRRLADQVTARVGSLDVLINNAGATRQSRQLTEDGIETTFAVNVVAPFCLTHELLPALTNSGAGRIINITGGIPRGKIDLDNLQGEKHYVGLSIYNQSKLAMMAMSHRFARRLDGRSVTLNVAYPGHAYTSMNRGLTADTYPPLARPIVPLLRLVMPVLYGNRALLRATRSSVHLAADPGVRTVHATYVDRSAKPTAWPAAAVNESVGETVWELCQSLCDRALHRPA